MAASLEHSQSTISGPGQLAIEMAWYCLRAKPRQESLAAQFLRSHLKLEVFAPRIRFKRARSTGVAWVNEALFPGYLFARFSYLSSYRHIAATRGVTKIISFGGQPVIVSDTMIDDLRKHVADQEIIEITPGIHAGDEIKVVDGPFCGVKALVTRLLPGRERVAILLQLLGGDREVEVSTEAILPENKHPLIPQDH